MGDPEYVDVYSLYPPNGDDALDQIFNFTSVTHALNGIDSLFPGASGRFVIRAH